MRKIRKTLVRLDIRFLSLLAAISIYGVFSTPTPDTPGLAEGMTGLFLIIAVGLPCFIASLNPFTDGPLWGIAGRVLLAYGLCAGGVTGIVMGHPAGDQMRDILAFLFMFLPVFLAKPVARSREGPGLFFTALACLGVVQSVRMLLDHFHPVFPDYLNVFAIDELHYLANSPCVLFAALILIGRGLQNLTSKNLTSSSQNLKGAVYIAAALLPLAGMALTLQRASLAAVLLLLIAVLAYGVWRRPLKTFPLILIGGGIAWAVQGPVGDIAAAMIYKTEIFGENMRIAEMKAVWAAIESHPASLIFGLGWGGGFSSPAVGGEYVTFTHGLITSALLKTGLAGMVITALYIGGLLMQTAFKYRGRWVLFYALSAPVMIDFFLYASFKSLDFGLVLLGLAVLYEQARLKHPACQAGHTGDRVRSSL